MRRDAGGTPTNPGFRNARCVRRAPRVRSLACIALASWVAACGCSRPSSHSSAAVATPAGPPARPALAGPPPPEPAAIADTNWPSPSPVVTDLVRVRTPAPGAVVTSPFTVEGDARGAFYFEAAFSVTLVDARGRLLTRAIAHADGVWQTNHWVPFRAELGFPAGAAGAATLVFDAANPSGLASHARTLRVPVRLGTSGPG